MLVIMLTQEKKELLFLSFFHVIIRLEFNLDVISDKLEWSPVPYLRKALRFTKGFNRLVNSSTSGYSFLKLLVERVRKLALQDGKPLGNVVYFFCRAIIIQIQ